VGKSGDAERGKAKSVNIKVTDWLAFYLDQLEPLGSYGDNRAEICWMLIRDHIHVLLDKKALTRIDERPH